MGHTIKTNGVDHWEIYSTIAEGPIAEFKSESELIHYLAKEKAYKGKLEAIREMFLFPSDWVVNGERLRQIDLDVLEKFKKWEREVTLSDGEERYALIDEKYDELMDAIKPKYTIFDYKNSKGSSLEGTLQPLVIKEVYTNYDVYDILDIDGYLYAVCMLSPKEKLIGVNKIKINGNPEPVTAQEFTCPYCNDEDFDAWEYTEDKGEVTCGCCDSEIRYERSSMKLPDDDWYIEYTVYPVKQKEIIKVK